MSAARSLGNLGNQNALTVDTANLKVGIVSTSPVGDLQVGAAITMGAASGIISATSYYGDGTNLTNVGVDTATVNTDQLNVIGVATVGSGVTINSTGIEVTSGIITAGTCFKAGGGSFGPGIGATILGSGNVIFAGIATASGLDAAISVWTLGASGTDHYTFTGPGNLSATADPDLQLIRGQKYIFQNRSGGHPFRIQSTVNGSSGSAYNTGVTNNDAADGTDLVFDVPFDAPPILYYQCTSHNNMGGAIYVGSSSGDNVILSGIATVGTALSLADNVHARFGNAGDLKIYHDSGGQSRIEESGSSVLKIMGSDLRLSNTSNSADYVQANDGAAVNIYFNGSKKLETTNTGVEVTGTATATEFVGGGSGLTGLSIPAGFTELDAALFN